MTTSRTATVLMFRICNKIKKELVEQASRPFAAHRRDGCAAILLWFLTLAMSGGMCAHGSDESSTTRSDDHLREPILLPGDSERLQAYREYLNSVARASSLRRWHDLFSAEPRIAGTPGNQRLIEILANQFDRLGLEVERHAFDAYLSHPVDAELQIVASGDEDDAGELPITLAIKEQDVPDDPYTDHPDLTFGFNAYAASGDVTGEVVYANYGTKEDFETLKELGVDVEGRIVIARYGRNYRGFKAKFAQQAGAIGLIMYTDPADSGYGRGVPYPEGGYANETSIQRGSIKTLPYPGDPLTPGREASKDAKRLDPEHLALPKIPVQPVGWASAQEIMSRMNGRPVPHDIYRKWQGGLPFAYRLTGGDELHVRVRIKQERDLHTCTNVIGKLVGEKWPKQKIIIGCHFDAWSFGAGDPHAGTIVMYEIAKSFATAAQQGRRPARTIVFANWDAEEYGIIGSTEWVEANADDLFENAVAYINLDMAAMGPNFRSSSSPTLKSVLTHAVQGVPQPGADDGVTVAEQWIGSRDEPDFGALGGGSDHVGFYCHLGVPSCSLGAGGSPGVSYHSNYENLHWYREVVGDDYEPALMLTRIGNNLAAQLAGATILPINPLRYARDTRAHLKKMQQRAESNDVSIEMTELRDVIDSFETAAEQTMRSLRQAAQADLSAQTIERVNDRLLQLERTWLDESGLPDRPWYRSLYAASDPVSGYAADMLPALRTAVDTGEARRVADTQRKYVRVFRNLTEHMRQLQDLLMQSKP